MKAPTKREISPSTVERVVDEIEAELRTRGKVEIPSREVGELVMDKLRGLDEVAYIRFASVYRSFMDLQEVNHEIDQLLSREKRGCPVAAVELDSVVNVAGFPARHGFTTRALGSMGLSTSAD